MSKEEIEFHKIGESIQEATKGKLFGKACYSIGKKAFVCFHEDAMVFKLPFITHSEALELQGSHLFDPSKKGRPMKEWVQVSYEHKTSWSQFAKSAARYISDLQKN
ncbi:MAG: hypothetical protein AAGA77_18580 [Bacteroidota bacterium]